jgi:hypothetical protein
VPQPSLFTGDELRGPLFRSLREIDKVEDPVERLAMALDRLDHLHSLALSRARGKSPDPDTYTALKIDETAHRLLSIEPRRVKVKAPDLSAFDRPVLVKAQ